MKNIKKAIRNIGSHKGWGKRAASKIVRNAGKDEIRRGK
jgi:hypothetical protein